MCLDAVYPDLSLASHQDSLILFERGKAFTSFNVLFDALMCSLAVLELVQFNQYCLEFYSRAFIEITCGLFVSSTPIA